MNPFQSEETVDHKENPFKWKHFSCDIILWGVRWYCQFALSYRDLVLMMAERGLPISHTTIMRWIHQYAPELKKRMKKHLRMTNDSWRVDETYVKIKGKWPYLYRAVDSEGNTLDWMLSEKRDQEAAGMFFEKLFSNEHCCKPRVINVDKNAAYPPAFESCQSTGLIPEKTKLRRIKYLNNIIEQEHRFSKRRIAYGQWLQTIETAEATIAGYETMHMSVKGKWKALGRKMLLFK